MNHYKNVYHDYNKNIVTKLPFWNSFLDNWGEDSLKDSRDFGPWLRKKIFRFSLPVFTCACLTVISSTFDKSFHFPLPYFVLSVLRYFPFHVVCFMLLHVFPSFCVRYLFVLSCPWILKNIYTHRKKFNIFYKRAFFFAKIPMYNADSCSNHHITQDIRTTHLRICLYTSIPGFLSDLITVPLYRQFYTFSIKRRISVATGHS